MSLLLLFPPPTPFTPSTLSGLICWHEACNQPEVVGSLVSGLVGVGGMPYGAPQTDTTKQPTLELLGSGRKVLRFDNSNDVMRVSATLSALPFTIVVMYASKSTSVGKRLLCNGSGGGNWLLGQRSESGSSKYSFYNSSFIHGDALDVDVLHTHSIRQQSAGTVAEYRIDGVVKGTNSSTTVPGALTFGGSDVFSGETANADVIGICIYDRFLTNLELADVENYWLTGCGGTTTPAYTRVTQEVIEAITSANPNIVLTQEVIEAVSGASPNLQTTQFVIEVVVGIGTVGRTRFWGTVIYGS